MQIGIKEIKVTDIGDIHIGQTQDAEGGVMRYLEEKDRDYPF